MDKVPFIEQCCILTVFKCFDFSSALLIFGAFLLPALEFYVIVLEKSARACDYPLLSLNVASIVLTFFTIGELI